MAMLLLLLAERTEPYLCNEMSMQRNAFRNPYLVDTVARWVSVSEACSWSQLSTWRKIMFC